MKNEKGRLIIISGPSGVGKSTVISRLMTRRSDIAFSVSATTRGPRPGEIDGVNYYFITRDKFKAMVGDGEFIEYAEYAGNMYGTPRGPVEKQLEAGFNVILDIDVQGAKQVIKAMPEAMTIFFAPPSFEVLEKRLRGRNQDSEEKILLRLQAARNEIRQAAEIYEYVVMNEGVNCSADEMEAIIRAERCKTANRLQYLDI